jgi:hypothetical protein
MNTSDLSIVRYERSKNKSPEPGTAHGNRDDGERCAPDQPARNDATKRPVIERKHARAA